MIFSKVENQKPKTYDFLKTSKMKTKNLWFSKKQQKPKTTIFDDSSVEIATSLTIIRHPASSAPLSSMIIIRQGGARWRKVAQGGARHILNMHCKAPLNRKSIKRHFRRKVILRNLVLPYGREAPSFFFYNVVGQKKMGRCSPYHGI